jgi:hypothetical protein
MNRFALAFLLCAVAAFGQIGTSTIIGRVTDPSGAVVPNVAVVIVNTGTNFQFTAVTNADGLFRVQSLPPGPYRVSFEAAGFKRVIRDAVDLRASDTLPVDATLEVGAVAESVEVKANAQLLETETSSSGALVIGSMYYKLPIYQRSVQFTLTVTPGLQLGNYGSAANGSTTPFNVAGARSSELGIFEDGVLGMNPNGNSNSVRSVENAVAEVKVLTSTLPAEYGHTAGGVISVVKKSGTNEFHGMASQFGRVRRMQHRLFFDRFKTSDAQPGAPNGVGTFFEYPDATAGGPVFIPKVYDGRNKTFFFFGWQKQVEKKSAIVTQQTPTLDMLAGDFNFGGAGNPIYDPLSTRRNADGTWARDLFPNRTVPLNRFDPVSRRIVQIDPWNKPNLPGSFNSAGPVSNYVYSENSRAFMEEYSMRLDHQFNTAFKIYASYTYDYALNLGRESIVNIADFDGFAGFPSTLFSGHNISTGGTWVISPTLVNDARASLFRQENTKPIPSFAKNWAQILGIPNDSPALMPAFGTTDAGSFAQGSIYGLAVSGPTHLIDEAMSFRNDLTKIVGVHAFKMGYELLHNRSNSQATNFPSGQFLFDTMTAGLQPNGQPLPNTGNTFAGFLAGAVRQATFDSQLTTWLPRSSIHSLYFQDDWKFSPTLTLNLGVRYSNESPFNTKYGLMSNFDPTVKDPLTGLTGAIVHPSSPLSKRDNNNFQPRIGVAWHPMKKWVFRGGFTVNTIDVRFPLSRDQFDEYAATNVQAQAPGDPRPIYTLSQGPQPVRFNIAANNTSPFVGTNYSTRNVAWWDPNLRNPYVMNWQTGLQYEINSSYRLDVYYQGSTGTGLIERWQANTFPIDYAVNNLTLRNQVFAASQNYRPYPQFGDILFRSNTGHSTYHSGTVKLERRYANGLMFTTFYTFAKSIDSQDGDNNGSGVAPLQNRGLEKARAGFDRNHRLNASFIYALPFGKGQKFLNKGGIIDKIFGGFELSWIQMLESGIPLTFSYANSPYNNYPTFAGTRRPDVTGKPALRDGWIDFGGDRFNQNNINPVIDLNNFAYPGSALGCPNVIPATLPATERQALIDKCSFLIGNSGRNIVTGTRLLYSQGSVQKNIPFKERFNFQIRLDFQNVFHNYAWSNPTTAVDFRNPNTFGKISADQRTSSIGGQPLMNLKLQLSW